MERVGSHDAAIKALASICEAAEQEYETSESTASLAHYAQAKTDLARNLLATRQYSSAVEEAEMALELLDDFDDASVLSAGALSKTRLSARLTAGLAHFHLSELDACIPYFRTSLEETNSDPDIICLLAEVLWAKGGPEEKEVAREQLITAVESHSQHVGIVTLLGAIAVLDADTETCSAVLDDLQALRTNKSLDQSQISRVEKVCEAISIHLGGEPEALQEIKRSVVLTPWKHTGWQDLAEASGEQFPAEFARETATKHVPPHGPLPAEELAKAYAGTGHVADTLRAVMLAPWCSQGWARLAECVHAE
jgi:superkiller protein 3